MTFSNLATRGQGPQGEGTALSKVPNREWCCRRFPRKPSSGSGRHLVRHSPLCRADPRSEGPLQWSWLQGAHVVRLQSGAPLV